jgi:hypothetical protein
MVSYEGMHTAKLASLLNPKRIFLAARLLSEVDGFAGARK